MQSGYVGRIARVLALVLALGAVGGAFTGAFTSLVLFFNFDALTFPRPVRLAFYAACFGALVGAVFGPLLAFTLLRRVPLYQAVLTTVLASSATISVVVLAGSAESNWVLIAPLASAGIAAIALRMWHDRRVASDRHTEPKVRERAS